MGHDDGVDQRVTMIGTEPGSTLVLSKVILGAMGFTDPKHSDAVRMIHAAVERGMTSIDTAPLYGAGENEGIVGAAISDRRDKVQLLTKCGLRWDTHRGAVLFRGTRDGKPWTPRRDSRPSAIAEEIDQCLRRLGTDYIDLMQVHHLDRDTPVADTMDALQRARTAGKIREIGVSNYPADELGAASDALKGELYSTQNLFNMLRSDAEEEVLQCARKLGVRFLAYSPLAQGVLAGRHLQAGTPRRSVSTNPYYHPKNLARVSHVLEVVARPMAAAHALSLGQLALAWTLAQPGISGVIVGGRALDQLLENAGALSATVPEDELQLFGRAMATCGWDPHPHASLRERAVHVARRAKRFLKNLLRKRR
jgi:aryl-alcohol dehydrogenase-like predicted oxidoreductase